MGLPSNDETKPLAIFYALRNHEGKFYRKYTRGYYPSRGWMPELADATLYTKLSTARTRITALSNEKPNLPVPQLVEFLVYEVNVVDQTERVAAIKAKKQREEAERAIAAKKSRVQEAERELVAAQRRLDILRRG